MGWWSAAIMGGDNPCDIEWEFKNIMNIKDDEPFTKDKLNEFLPQLIAYCEDSKEDTTWHVLGYHIMKHGVPLHITLKNRIIKAAQSDEEWREGSNYDSERESYINEFIQQLTDYSGQPTESHQPGLFESLNEKISKGDNGLLNKNI